MIRDFNPWGLELLLAVGYTMYDYGAAGTYFTRGESVVLVTNEGTVEVL